MSADTPMTNAPRSVTEPIMTDTKGTPNLHDHEKCKACYQTSAALATAQAERDAIVALLNSEVHETRAELEAAQAELAECRRDVERYKARRASIFQTRLRIEMPQGRNWKPTTVEEFNAEYDAACDKEVSEQAARGKS